MMLLGNRRHRTVYMALAGMDVAWMLPFVLTWISRTRGWNEFPFPTPAAFLLAEPLLLFGVCWLTMMVYMLAADVLDRQQIDAPRRELIILTLVVATSIIGIRLLLYPIRDYADASWLADTWSAVFNFSEGLRPPLLLIIVNSFLWIRVALAADRELSFFGVGVSFRLGMLLSLIGGALLATLGGQTRAQGSRVALLYFTLFFALGLIAVAVARIDEKAVGAANSTGAILPYLRLGQIFALASLILVSSLGLGALLSPHAIRRSVAVLEPIWRVLGWALTAALILVFLLIGPLLDRMVIALQRMAANAEPNPPPFKPLIPSEYLGVESVVREYTVLRYCFVIGAIVLTLALLWFLWVQPKTRPRARDEEEAVSKEAAARSRFRPPRMDMLREWLKLLRKYGVGQRLLNAVTVQNMYANLGRLASKRGYPRRPSQPPDSYLPVLEHAFPGQEERLERITAAYMRVHYGDLPVDRDELGALREDYARIVEAPVPDRDDLRITPPSPEDPSGG